ncbi:hypothetical protein Dsin_018617 [Dipteronia sinensis]|uniref:Uncharacterized protein n=1 Tax=Dipteronia sinensis TaxID=43782 RepID=A0AAE0A758_9ROSI|nr:hypothetical protein Dsin_018617 [Dipteronia sinensis]
MVEVRDAINGQKGLDVNSVEPDLKRAKKGWGSIIFSEVDVHELEVRTNDATVVLIHICHREEKRVLIDNGSSMDNLSAGVFDQLGLQRKDLHPLTIPLRGFIGAEVRSLGIFKLPVDITYPYQRTVLFDFKLFDVENWPL